MSKRRFCIALFLAVTLTSFAQHEKVEILNKDSVVTRLGFLQSKKDGFYAVNDDGVSSFIEYKGILKAEVLTDSTRILLWDKSAPEQVTSFREQKKKEYQDVLEQKRIERQQAKEREEERKKAEAYEALLRYIDDMLQDDLADKSPVPYDKVIDQNPAFKLFKTQNIFNFLKLDTRNGRIWIVQYSTDNNRLVSTLNNVRLATGSAEVEGRFTLMPTENIWNFIMLDQIDGRTWQVQWNTNPESCLVVPIR